MEDEIYTIDQIREIHEQQKYKFIGLNDIKGKEVIKQNAAKVTPLDKLDVIETRLKAPRFKDGYYIVYCKHHHAGQPDNYTIVKGDVKTLKEEPPAPTIPPLPIKQDEVLSYDAALKMHREISDLTNTVGMLERELAIAKDDLEEAYDLIDEYEDDEGSLGEDASSIGTVIKETVTALIPVLDRHFDLKEGQLQIEKGKLLKELESEQDATRKVTPNGQQQPQDAQYTILTEEQEDALPDDQFDQYRQWLLHHYYNNDQQDYAELLKRIEEEDRINTNASD